MIDKVLTSLVNNDYLLNRLVEDMNNRYSIDVDKDKLIKYLSTYAHNQDTINAW